MADLLAGDDKNRDLTCDEAYRWYLITRSDPPGDYRFGGTRGKRLRVRARTALRRVERELELRGIRFDRPNDSWETRKGQPAERSR